MPAELKDRIAELAADLPRGWQARLAKYCKVSQPSVSGWVSGDTKSLDGMNLQMAAEFFGAEPKWLATGKGPKLTKFRSNSGHVAAAVGVAEEPPPAYRVDPPAGKAPAADYRTIVHTLADALESSGQAVNVRTFVNMVEASYRKMSR